MVNKDLRQKLIDNFVHYIFDHPEERTWVLNKLGLQDLAQTLVRVMNATIYGCLAGYIFLALTIIIMIGIFLRNGSLKSLPKFVLIAIPCYVLYALYGIGIFIYLSYLSIHSQISAMREGTIQILVSVNILIFLMLQWQFAAHYFRSAMLFKTTIISLSDTQHDKLSRTRTKLTVFEYAVYGVLMTMAAVLCIFTSTDVWPFIFESYWLVSNLAMALVTIWAMHNIHKSSEGLENLGITKNSFLMKLYIAFWLGLTINTVTEIVLNAIANMKWPDYQFDDVGDIKQFMRMLMAMIGLTLVQNTNAILLNLVILAYYWKAGDKLSKELASNMTRAISRQSMRRARSQIETSQDSEAEEREKA